MHGGGSWGGGGGAVSHGSGGSWGGGGGGVSRSSGGTFRGSGSWGGNPGSAGVSSAPRIQPWSGSQGLTGTTGRSFGQPSTSQWQTMQLHQFSQPSTGLQRQSWGLQSTGVQHQSWGQWGNQSSSAVKGWTSHQSFSATTGSLGSGRFDSGITGGSGRLGSSFGGTGRVTMNGSTVHFPVSPRMENGHLTAPVSTFVQKMGGRMSQDSKTGDWSIQRDGHELRFHEGDRFGFFDGRRCDLFVAPFFYDGFLYCSLDPFWDYFGVPYDYYPYDYPVGYPMPYAVAPQQAVAPSAISEGLAISLASRYLVGLGQYPDSLIEVTAHQNIAPANAFWDAVAAGRQPLANAPERPCWVVEYQFSQGGQQAWKQVFVDVENGQVIGGSAS
jgi:hypothetical protein